MEKIIIDKEAVVDALVNMDPVYQHMQFRQSELEKKFDKMVAQLSDEQKALAWEFVMACEDMNRRTLYLACKYMDFQGMPNSEIILPDNFIQQRAAAKVLAHRFLNLIR